MPSELNVGQRIRPPIRFRAKRPMRLPAPGTPNCFAISVANVPAAALAAEACGLARDVRPLIFAASIEPAELAAAPPRHPRPGPRSRSSGAAASPPRHAPFPRLPPPSRRHRRPSAPALRRRSRGRPACRICRATGEIDWMIARSFASSGPSRERGGVISVRSTIDGAPSSCSSETSASPTFSSVIAVATSSSGIGAEGLRRGLDRLLVARGEGAQRVLHAVAELAGDRLRECRSGSA